jgi:hypothetical protein
MQKNGQLVVEQFGGRNGLTSILQVINKRFTLNVTRQSKIFLALCSNDAKSCFDRVVHAVTSIAVQQQNVPKYVCICIFTTLQNTRHIIRTVYGDSEAGYVDTLSLIRYHGIGQGNGSGPTIWEIVSSPVLNALQAQGYGCF